MAVRPLFRVALMLIGAAAVTALPALAQAPMRARVGLRGYRDPIAMDTLASEYMVNASTGKTFAAASQVFKTLGFAATVRDSIGGLIGNEEFNRSRTLVGSPMSTWLNCGSGMTGPNADSFRITIALMIIIDPAPNNTTRMRIGMVGSGANIVGNSTDPVACATTGRLEERIAQLIRGITG
jgi:hypothetical protein